MKTLTPVSRKVTQSFCRDRFIGLYFSKVLWHLIPCLLWYKSRHFKATSLTYMFQLSGEKKTSPVRSQTELQRRLYQRLNERLSLLSPRQLTLFLSYYLLAPSTVWVKKSFRMIFLIWLNKCEGLDRLNNWEHLPLSEKDLENDLENKAILIIKIKTHFLT